MQNLDEFYESMGSSASEIVGRLGGSADLVMRFLGKFPADDSFTQLKQALEAGDGETAFRAAHTMKGLCANLGLQHLFDKSSAVTEMLRGEADMAAATEALPDLDAEYQRTLAALKELGIE